MKGIQWTKMILPLFLVFIMVFSGALIGYQGSSAFSTESYGFTFEQKQNGWTTSIDGNDVHFDYLPEEVEDIVLDPGALEGLKVTKQIYATSNQNDTNKETIALVQYELVTQLDSDFSVYLQTGFSTQNSFGKSMIDCSSATSSAPVLFLETANETAISIQGNCIMLRADSPFGFVKLKNRLLYGMHGIV